MNNYTSTSSSKSENIARILETTKLPKGDPGTMQKRTGHSSETEIFNVRNSQFHVSDIKVAAQTNRSTTTQIY